MIAIDSNYEIQVADDKLIENFPLLRQLNDLIKALAICCEEAHNFAMSGELRWISEDLVKTIDKGLIHHDEFNIYLRQMDKARAYCSLLHEILFNFWDEVAEDTFEKICSSLVQMKQDLNSIVELYQIKIAFEDMNFYSIN